MCSVRLHLLKSVLAIGSFLTERSQYSLGLPQNDKCMILAVSWVVLRNALQQQKSFIIDRDMKCTCQKDCSLNVSLKVCQILSNMKGAADSLSENNYPIKQGHYTRTKHPCSCIFVHSPLTLSILFALSNVAAAAAAISIIDVLCPNSM